MKALWTYLTLFVLSLLSCCYGDYKCLCYYDTEKSILIYSAPDTSSQTVGHMLGKNCKPVYTGKGSLGGIDYIAVQFGGKIGYISKESDVEIQACSGQPPDPGLDSTTVQTNPLTASTTTLKTSPTRTGINSTTTLTAVTTTPASTTTATTKTSRPTTTTTTMRQTTTTRTITTMSPTTTTMHATTTTSPTTTTTRPTSATTTPRPTTTTTRPTTTTRLTTTTIRPTTTTTTTRPTTTTRLTTTTIRPTTTTTITRSTTTTRPTKTTMRQTPTTTPRPTTMTTTRPTTTTMRPTTTTMRPTTPRQTTTTKRPTTTTPRPTTTTTMRHTTTRPTTTTTMRPTTTTMRPTTPRPTTTTMRPTTTRTTTTTTRPTTPAPVTWPSGTYGLMQTTNGCPGGLRWLTGWRRQDTEDDDSHNYYTAGIQYYLAGEFDKNNLLMKYCIKNVVSTSVYDKSWPKGSYCILKYHACPSGFSSGFIFHDDEDDDNINAVGGTLPDGQYDSNTRVDYCCRGDGYTSSPIILPTERPFILMRFTSACQTVHGMSVREVYLRWDDEDDDNASKSGGSHPSDTGGSMDHLLHFCYYEHITDPAFIG